MTIEDEIYQDLKRRYKDGNYSVAENKNTIVFLFYYIELLKGHIKSIELPKPKEQFEKKVEQPENVKNALKGANTR